MTHEQDNRHRHSLGYSVVHSKRTVRTVMKITYTLHISRADLGGGGGHGPQESKMPNIVQHDTETTQCWYALQ